MDFNNALIDFYYIHVDGILPKGPYPPCLRMADRSLLAGYPRCIAQNSFMNYCKLIIKGSILLMIISLAIFIGWKVGFAFIPKLLFLPN